jgi:hypothetical protein
MSSSCAPIRCTGLSAFIAPWNTIEISLQRKARRSRPPRLRMSVVPPSSRRHSIAPPVICAGGCSSRVTVYASVDLPQPDSPARPTISPGWMSSETPSTARTGRSVT